MCACRVGEPAQQCVVVAQLCAAETRVQTVIVLNGVQAAGEPRIVKGINIYSIEPHASDSRKMHHPISNGSCQGRKEIVNTQPVAHRESLALCEPTRFPDPDLMTLTHRTRRVTRKFLSEEPDVRRRSLVPDQERTTERLALIRSAAHTEEENHDPRQCRPPSGGAAANPSTGLSGTQSFPLIGWSGEKRRQNDQPNRSVDYPALPLRRGLRIRR